MHTLTPLAELLEGTLLEDVAIPLVGTLLFSCPADGRSYGKRCDGFMLVKELRWGGEAHTIVGSQERQRLEELKDPRLTTVHRSEYLIVHVEEREVFSFGKPLDSAKELVGGDGILGRAVVGEVVRHQLRKRGVT